MWVIDAPTGALLAVEVLNNREPWPRPREAALSTECCKWLGFAES